MHTCEPAPWLPSQNIKAIWSPGVIVYGMLVIARDLNFKYFCLCIQSQLSHHVSFYSYIVGGMCRTIDCSSHHQATFSLCKISLGQ